jgi:integrase
VNRLRNGPRDPGKEVNAFLTSLAVDGAAHVEPNDRCPAHLVALRLYQAGLRLLEGLMLRVKEVDFERGQIHEHRHHLHERVVQRAVKNAAREAGRHAAAVRSRRASRWKRQPAHRSTPCT